MRPDQLKAVIAGCIAFLQDHGYTVDYAPGVNEWVSPSRLSHRYKLHPNTISNRLRHPNCPVFERSPAEGKRIRKLRMNPALHRFLKQPSRLRGGYVKNLLPIEDLE